MCCNVRGTWCWEAITPLRQRRTKTHFMGTQTSASVIRSRFTLKNTQEWRWSALDLAKFIPPHPWLHYCHSNSAICIWDPFFLSSPPIKKRRPEGSSRHPWKTPRAQTPPPLRSTVTGPLSSRVSSADFIRMARRLSDTWPFFTALISCTGNRADVWDNKPRAQDCENTHNSRLQSRLSTFTSQNFKRQNVKPTPTEFFTC